MNRRHFAAALAASPLFLPLAVRAQAGRLRRIGSLSPAAPAVDAVLRAELVRAMRTLGYVEGSTLQIEARSSGGQPEKLDAMAAELVAAGVEVIVTVTPKATLAAARASRRIPIVMGFWGGEGLLESGLVSSFARPGGNVTGVNMLADELEGKRLEVLLQAVPRAKVIGVLHPGVTSTVDGKPVAPQVEQAARAGGVTLRLSALSDTGKYNAVFDGLRAERVDAVLVPTTPRFLADHVQIVEAAAKTRLPTMYPWGDYARAGGLLAYGPVFSELQLRVATFVDRILKGAKPGDLPIEQPSKFELVVNQRTAKTLNFVIPNALLLRADKVIE